MSSFFVTATGTDVGKTYVSAGIIRAARAAGRRFSAVKPVLSGFDPQAPDASDPAILLAAMERRITPPNIAAIAPWRFAAPLSPDMAAAREGRTLDFDALIAFCETAMEAAADTLLIEGVGGVAVPLDATHLVAEWIAALRIPAILVAGTYLGTISHTLTAAEALTACGIEIDAIVLSESCDPPVPAGETADTLNRFLPQLPIHIIPRDFNDRSFRQLAEALG
jgi:dethiobiotin synthetase